MADEVSKPEDLSPEEPVQPGPNEDDKAPGLPFPVVGVGASAGGLEAFTDLVSNLTRDAGLAILFVLHLEPHHKSYLAEVLGRESPLPIKEAAEGMPVEVNNVYVIRPNTDMALVDGHLTISRRAVRGQHMPIDHMFRSLARIQKSAAVGVILSGGGTDGVLGFRAIKSEGGITFAQDEKSAKHTSMPLSAVADSNVDYILPPSEIAAQLLRLTNHPYTREPHVQEQPADAVEIITEIIAGLRGATGVDFSHYKRTTIQRRIERRMALRNVEKLGDYLDLVRKEPTEIQNLYRDFLICVTQFFRDPEAYEALKERVFPKLIEGRSPDVPIRIWSAGCATGEEVYSLAICLLEYLAGVGQAYTAKFLATDLNEPALDKARAGVYLDNIEADVSPERLRRFFIRSGGHYQISKSVRDLCVFSKHNLVTDPPFSRLDLISCRNVLIYMNTTLQKRVLPVLHYALNPGGFLFLGSSESIGGSELFDVVDPRHRIFSRKAVATPPVLNLSPFPLVEGTARAVRAEAGQLWSALDVQKEADRIVIARFAPVGVVVDEAGVVVQFRGRTAPFLEPAPGMASLDLMRMLREGLMAEVRGAFNQARAENIIVSRDGLRVTDDGKVRDMRLEVIPFKVPPTGLRFFLVLFEDLAKAGPQASPAAAPAPSSSSSEQQVVQLQQELGAVREYLQSIIEEQESTNEELKSANEEILSANEELQSTNEELQTAKEEAQSANEELATVNEELRHRNTELAHVNNDLINLLAGVNIPIVMVSRDLLVRRFTPQAAKVFNLIPTDVGRPISDLKTNLQVPDFAQLVATVIDTLAPYEAGIGDNQGASYVLRIRPYVTMDNKIEGASIVLLEIDSIMKGMEQAKTPGK